MDVQTISNIVLSTLSTLLVVISVVIAVATLRQNSKMIESQSRPYIGVSSIKMNNGTPIFELVVKNFGASSAEIVRFTCDTDLARYYPGDERPLFHGIEGTTLMPGQSLICGLHHRKLFDDGIESLRFNVKYKWNGKEFEDESVVGVSVHENITQIRVLNNDDAMKNISFALQTIAENTSSPS